MSWKTQFSRDLGEEFCVPEMLDQLHKIQDAALGDIVLISFAEKIRQAIEELASLQRIAIEVMSEVENEHGRALHS